MHHNTHKYLFLSVLFIALISCTSQQQEFSNLTATPSITPTAAPTETPAVTPTNTPAPTATPSYLTIESLDDIPDYPGSKPWHTSFRESPPLIFRMQLLLKNDLEDSGLVRGVDFWFKAVELPRATTLSQVYDFYLAEGFGPLELTKLETGISWLLQNFSAPELVQLSQITKTGILWHEDDFFIYIYHLESGLAQRDPGLLFLRASASYLEQSDE
jgi:hypothetical protein